MNPILYLNEADLEGLNLDSGRLVDILEKAFRHKAAGAVQMPAKIFFQFPVDRFYSAMACSCPPLGFAGNKWQSGDPANPSRGLPYIQGLYVLNEHETGQMVSIMDARWITGKRTASSSALVARYQARVGSEELALLGCGLQGRAHLQAMAVEFPTLKRCRVFDIVPERQERFVAETDGRYGGIRVIGSSDAKAAVHDADIVIPGGTIQARRDPTIVSDWIKPGALVVTIDYDSYVTDECVAAMDLVLTDDRAQIEDAREKEGKFRGVKRIDAELAELIASGQGARTSDEQRILAFNLGIALEDLATAAELYRLAVKEGIGVRLQV